MDSRKKDVTGQNMSAVVSKNSVKDVSCSHEGTKVVTICINGEVVHVTYKSCESPEILTKIMKNQKEITKLQNSRLISKKSLQGVKNKQPSPERAVIKVSRETLNQFSKGHTFNLNKSSEENLKIRKKEFKNSCKEIKIGSQKSKVEALEHKGSGLNKKSHEFDDKSCKSSPKSNSDLENTEHLSQNSLNISDSEEIQRKFNASNPVQSNYNSGKIQTQGKALKRSFSVSSKDPKLSFESTCTLTNQPDRNKIEIVPMAQNDPEAVKEIAKVILPNQYEIKCEEIVYNGLQKNGIQSKSHVNENAQSVKGEGKFLSIESNSKKDFVSKSSNDRNSQSEAYPRDSPKEIVSYDGENVFKFKKKNSIITPDQKMQEIESTDNIVDCKNSINDEDTPHESPKSRNKCYKEAIQLKIDDRNQDRTHDSGGIRSGKKVLKRSFNTISMDRMSCFDDTCTVSNEYDCSKNLPTPVPRWEDSEPAKKIPKKMPHNQPHHKHIKIERNGLEKDSALSFSKKKCFTIESEGISKDILPNGTKDLVFKPFDKGKSSKSKVCRSHKENRSCDKQDILFKFKEKNSRNTKCDEPKEIISNKIIESKLRNNCSVKTNMNDNSKENISRILREEIRKSVVTGNGNQQNNSRRDLEVNLKSSNNKPEKLKSLSRPANQSIGDKTDLNYQKPTSKNTKSELFPNVLVDQIKNDKSIVDQFSIRLIKSPSFEQEVFTKSTTNKNDLNPKPRFVHKKYSSSKNKTNLTTVKETLNGKPLPSQTNDHPEIIRSIKKHESFLSSTSSNLPKGSSKSSSENVLNAAAGQMVKEDLRSVSAKYGLGTKKDISKQSSRPKEALLKVVESTRKLVESPISNNSENYVTVSGINQNENPNGNLEEKIEKFIRKLSRKHGEKVFKSNQNGSLHVKKEENMCLKNVAAPEFALNKNTLKKSDFINTPVLDPPKCMSNDSDCFHNSGSPKQIVVHSSKGFSDTKIGSTFPDFHKNRIKSTKKHYDKLSLDPEAVHTSMKSKNSHWQVKRCLERSVFLVANKKTKVTANNDDSSENSDLDEVPNINLNPERNSELKLKIITDRTGKTFCEKQSSLKKSSTYSMSLPDSSDKHPPVKLLDIGSKVEAKQSESVIEKRDEASDINKKHLDCSNCDEKITESQVINTKNVCSTDSVKVVYEKCGDNKKINNIETTSGVDMKCNAISHLPAKLEIECITLDDDLLAHKSSHSHAVLDPTRDKIRSPKLCMSIEMNEKNIGACGDTEDKLTLYQVFDDSIKEMQICDVAKEMGDQNVNIESATAKNLPENEKSKIPIYLDSNKCGNSKFNFEKIFARVSEIPHDPGNIQQAIDLVLSSGEFLSVEHKAKMFDMLSKFLPGNNSETVCKKEYGSEPQTKAILSEIPQVLQKASDNLKFEKDFVKSDISSKQHDSLDLSSDYNSKREQPINMKHFTPKFCANDDSFAQRLPESNEVHKNLTPDCPFTSRSSTPLLQPKIETANLCATHTNINDNFPSNVFNSVPDPDIKNSTHQGGVINKASDNLNYLKSVSNANERKSNRNINPNTLLNINRNHDSGQSFTAHPNPHPGNAQNHLKGSSDHCNVGITKKWLNYIDEKVKLLVNQFLPSDVSNSVPVPEIKNSTYEGRVMNEASGNLNYLKSVSIAHETNSIRGVNPNFPLNINKNNSSDQSFATHANSPTCNVQNQFKTSSDNCDGGIMKRRSLIDEQLKSLPNKTKQFPSYNKTILENTGNCGKNHSYNSLDVQKPFPNTQNITKNCDQNIYVGENLKEMTTNYTRSTAKKDKGNTNSSLGDSGSNKLRPLPQEVFSPSGNAFMSDVQPLKTSCTDHTTFSAELNFSNRQVSDICSDYPNNVQPTENLKSSMQLQYSQDCSKATNTNHYEKSSSVNKLSELVNNFPLAPHQGLKSYVPGSVVHHYPINSENGGIVYDANCHNTFIPNNNVNVQNLHVSKNFNTNTSKHPQSMQNYLRAPKNAAAADVDYGHFKGQPCFYPALVQPLANQNRLSNNIARNNAIPVVNSQTTQMTNFNNQNYGFIQETSVNFMNNMHTIQYNPNSTMQYKPNPAMHYDFNPMFQQGCNPEKGFSLNSTSQISTHVNSFNGTGFPPQNFNQATVIRLT